MKSVAAKEFYAWQSTAPSYLGLSGRFSQLFPPVCFICDEVQLMRTPPAQRVLLVSLEPLQTPSTFAAQLAYVAPSGAPSLASMLNYQFDFFTLYPKLIGKVRQTYWRQISILMEGWSKLATPTSSINWSLLASRLVEVPMLPLHASQHQPIGPSLNPAAWQCFVDRMDAAIRQTQPSRILALGADAGVVLARYTGCTGYATLHNNMILPAKGYAVRRWSYHTGGRSIACVAGGFLSGRAYNLTHAQRFQIGSAL